MKNRCGQNFEDVIQEGLELGKLQLAELVYDKGSKYLGPISGSEMDWPYDLRKAISHF